MCAALEREELSSLSPLPAVQQKSAAILEEDIQLVLPCRAFADSKTLTEEKRESLFEEVLADSMMGYAVDCISAADISSQMLRR